MTAQRLVAMLLSVVTAVGCESPVSYEEPEGGDVRRIVASTSELTLVLRDSVQVEEFVDISHFAGFTGEPLWTFVDTHAPSRVRTDVHGTKYFYPVKEGELEVSCRRVEADSGVDSVWQLFFRPAAPLTVARVGVKLTPFVARLPESTGRISVVWSAGTFTVEFHRGFAETEYLGLPLWLGAATVPSCPQPNR